MAPNAERGGGQEEAPNPAFAAAGASVLGGVRTGGPARAAASSPSPAPLLPSLDRSVPSFMVPVPDSPRGTFGGKGIAVTVRNLTFEVVDNRPKEKTKENKGGGGDATTTTAAAGGEGAAAGAASSAGVPKTIKEDEEELNGATTTTANTNNNRALHEIVVDGGGSGSGNSSGSAPSSPPAERAAAAAAAAAPGPATPPPPASRGRRLLDAVTGAARKPRLALLTDVTAAFPAGRLTALMGPSGSGKSTLLDLMSGRKTTGRVTAGTVLFAGQRASAPFLRRYAGYVEQFDTLLPVLTPREMLLYTAELKRPVSEGRALKREAVEAVLDKLALRSCADVVIGSALSKGISGGQSKRTNIGIALVTSPRVLFLDEPTSGLDSFTANEVMAVVRRLAVEDGTTIISTIHSPTAYAFSLFHDLLLLVGGRTVYYGRASRAAEVALGQLLPAVRETRPDLVASLTEGSEALETELRSSVAGAGTGGGGAARHGAGAADVESGNGHGSSLGGGGGLMSGGGGGAGAGSLGGGNWPAHRPSHPGPSPSPEPGAPLLPVTMHSVNPAEMLLDLFTSADRKGGAGAFADAWAACPERAAGDARVARIEAASRVDLPQDVVRELATRRETVTPGWWAMLTMVRFRTRRNYVDAEFIGPRVGDKIILSLIIVTLYLGVGKIWRPDNYINMAAVLFMFVVMPAFSAAAYVPALFLERGLFQRERADGLYSVTTYLAYKMFDELVIGALGSFVACTAVFYGVGLSGSLLLFWLTYFSIMTVGVLLAFCIASLAPTMDVANCALPGLVSTFLFFAGFLIRFEDIPRWWMWFSYCDPLRYAFTANMVNHFGARNPRFLGTQTVLGYFGVEGQSGWSSMGIVWLFSAGLSAVTWCVLHRNFVKR